MTESMTPPTVEKRTEVRVPCQLKALYQPRARPALFTRWGTCIRNVSRGGLGLLLPLRLRRGTRLVVEVPAADGHDSCTIEVETVRSQLQPDGSWEHGCVPVGHNRPDNLLRTLCGRPGTAQMLEPGMGPEQEISDRFVLFLRAGGGKPERALASYDGYAEARKAQREFARAHCDCVIRFVGPTGGGD